MRIGAGEGSGVAAARTAARSSTGSRGAAPVTGAFATGACVGVVASAVRPGRSRAVAGGLRFSVAGRSRRADRAVGDGSAEASRVGAVSVVSAGNVGASFASAIREIGRAHVGTPVTNAHIVCRLLLEKKK